MRWSKSHVGLTNRCSPYEGCQARRLISNFCCPDAGGTLRRQILAAHLLSGRGLVKVERSRARGRVASNTLIRPRPDIHSRAAFCRRRAWACSNRFSFPAFSVVCGWLRRAQLPSSWPGVLSWSPAPIRASAPHAQARGPSPSCRAGLGSAFGRNAPHLTDDPSPDQLQRRAAFHPAAKINHSGKSSLCF